MAFLEVEMNAGMQEAHSEGLQPETTAQVIEAHAGFNRKSQAFDSWDKKLRPKASEEFGARAVIGADHAAAQKEVKIQIGFEKKVFEEFDRSDRSGRAAGVDSDYPRDRDVARQSVLYANARHPVRGRAARELAVIAQAQSAVHVACMDLPAEEATQCQRHNNDQGTESSLKPMQSAPSEKRITA